MEQQPWPSELNAARQGHGLELKDKYTVRYIVDARNSSNNDVGGIQANHPIPSNCTVYYYELTVLDQGLGGKIAIGFADRSFKLTRQPGWENGSYGYHGDDGKKFIGNGAGEDYGPTFGTGDTVGAGIIMSRQELFFTKNGTKLKTAVRSVRQGLYPTIGLHSKGEMVQVNFGQKPFMFDLEALLAEEKAAHKAAVDRIPVAPGTIHQLVRQYLLHYGYRGTLQTFDEAAGLTTDASEREGPSSSPAPTGTGAASSLPLRAAVRQALSGGDVDGALALLGAQCPGVLNDAGRYGDVHFHLACQKYIELVRCGCAHAAVEFAQTTLAHLVGPYGSPLAASLRDVVALVAYPDPTNSPLAHLLGQAQREAVADAVNAAVLEATAAGGCGGVPAAGTGAAEVSGSSRSCGEEEEETGDGEEEEVSESGRSCGGAAMECHGQGAQVGKAVLGAGQGAGPAPTALLSLRPALQGSEGVAAGRPVSRVEALLQQLEAVQGALGEVNGGQGAAFNLREYMVGSVA